MSIITARYWGRTGNVLFEIAAAITYANRFNRPFAFTSFPGFPNLDKYSPSLFGFADDDEFAKSLQDYAEEDFVKNVPFPADVNVRLTGFYQDHKLFEPVKAQVFDVLGIPQIREDALSKIGPKFNQFGLFGDNAITVSLHIRKGDYQDLKCYFLNLDEYYYKGALLKMAEKLGPAQIKVLCFYEKKSAEPSKQLVEALKDDPDLANYDLEYYHFSELMDDQVSDVEELAIMSHCNHHILANSTYSWWGAYMNPDPEKIVCYPDEHYNHQLHYLSSAGLNLPEWISVKAWSPKKYKCECWQRCGYRVAE